MNETTAIRDGIWGDVRLGPRELALIDIPAFQRLRRVRQLGFTDLVFPGATHTRFEHSLGVFHLAGLVAERLVRLPEAPVPDPVEQRGFLAAALLHDVGHYPFSHAIEELEMEQVRRHEDIAHDLITTGEIAEVLRERWDVPPELVAFFVAGPRPATPRVSEASGVLRTLLDSDLDVDKLDYLVRDARAANVPYGVVDVQRLIGCLTVWHDPVDGEPRLAVEAKGVPSLQSLVFAKHLMFATVYWHHACRAAVAMLLRAVQAALAAGAIDASRLEGSDDAALLRALGESRMPPLTRTLGGRLLDRRLYKRAFDVGVDTRAFEALERLWFRPDDRAALEDRWASECEAAPGEVLIDVPEPKPVARHLPPIVFDAEARGWDEVSGLGTDDLVRFQRWVRKIRVFAANRELATRAAAGRDRLLEEL